MNALMILNSTTVCFILKKCKYSEYSAIKYEFLRRINMKIHSLKFKLLGFIFIIIVLLAGSIVINNIIKFNNYLNQNMNTEISNSNKIINDKIMDLENDSLNVATYLSINPTTIEALEEKDNQKLFSTVKPIIDNCKVDFITVTDENGIVLVRSYEPEKKETVF